MNLAQWAFFVLPTRALDERMRSQRSISLPSLRNLVGNSFGFSGLKQAVEEAAANQRQRPDGAT